MKALKIIGVVLGSLAVLTGLGFVITAFAITQVVKADQIRLAQQGNRGPYPGHTVGQTGKRTWEVSWTEGKRSYHTEAVVFGTSRPDPGELVDIWRDPSSPHTTPLISRAPQLQVLAGGIRVKGFVIGGLGLLVTAGSITALALGRRRVRTRSGPPQPPRPIPPQPIPPQPGPWSAGPSQRPPGPGQPPGPTYPPVPGPPPGAR